MSQSQYNDFRQLNLLTMVIGALYHDSSTRLGITDNIALVLHFLYDNGQRCPVSDMYKLTGVPKQTINSSLRRLESAGIIFLEPYNGRSKQVRLTEKGEEFMHQTIGQLRGAEIHALDDWSPEDVESYIALMTKFAASLRREFIKLESPTIGV